jgi:undecaprenyl-diphosphatase
MERKDKIFFVIFLMIVVTLILIVTLNLNFFYNFINKYVGIYGYPAVFIFSFLSDVIDQPIGPEVPASVGAVFGLDPLFTFLLAVFGSWSISLINFYIGSKFLSEKLERVCKTKSYINYCKLFYKYGPVALLIAALTPVPYVFTIWLSGSFHMKLRNFFIFGLLARALRIGVILFFVILFF